MERRGKRGAAIAEVRTTRASSKSPSRRSSASRNRSPARNASPARTKSTSTTQRRSARNKITDNDTASETDDSKSDILTKVSIRVSPLKLDKDGRVSTTPSKLRKASSKSKFGNDGDDEVASLTAKYLNDKLNAGENPTPSDLSTGKRSYSRSMSRSMAEDDDWSHSDTSEKMYGNRITRSRSKTQNRREQSLSNDAAAEFGGSLGASLLIVLLPILCYSVQYVCSRPECSYKSIRWEKLKLLSSYFTLEAGYLYLALKWIVCVISIIPHLGVKRQLSQSTGADAQPIHYFNGFATAGAIVSGLGAAEYYFKYPMITLIYKNYQQLCFISFVYAMLISIWCFVRSAYFPVRLWNPYGKSGRLVSDLFIGREINPKWLNVFDIKFVHRRIALISALIFNLIFLARNIKYAAIQVGEAPLTYTEIALQFIQNIKLDPVAATISCLIIIYVLDALIFEHHITSSFEIQSEGVGAQLLLQYASFPVWTSLMAKYALQHKITGVPNWFLAIVCILYISGLVLKRLSNELKYHYRVYPTSNRSSGKFSFKLFSILSSIFQNSFFYFVCFDSQFWVHCRPSKGAVY